MNYVIPFILYPFTPRGKKGNKTSLADLANANIHPDSGRFTPLAQVAVLNTTVEPAAIRHRQGIRTASVFAEVGPGATVPEILSRLNAELPPDALPEHVSLSFGGASEGSKEANSAMLATIPVGLLLLLCFLMLEFNSFRRVGIVLITIPLALPGIVPGLLLSQQPFGFMSLLGVITLTGIVVNNAIVLLDMVEQCRAAGMKVAAAVEQAVRKRTRPVLLTTGTTVCRLIPLAVTDAALWPPMAWPMISGLLVSAALTLVVIPAVYCLLFQDPRPRAPNIELGLPFPPSTGAGVPQV